MSNDLIVTSSWDDGQEVDLKLVKLLDKYHVMGTFYVTESYKDPLEKSSLIEIAKKHEVGAHTLTHVDLAKIPASEAIREIQGSKDYLEELLGIPIEMFAYPFNSYSPEIKEAVKKAGFLAARTCNHGDIKRSNDLYEWPITLHASNSSPRVTFNIWRKNHISARSLLDWPDRARLLFDKALMIGGIYHIWAHGYEFEYRNEWDKLESLIKYISERKNVRYMTNGQICDMFLKGAGDID